MLLRGSLLLVFALSYASPAFAAWGERWGEMAWGAAAPPAVPLMDGMGTGLLAVVLIGLAMQRLRSRGTLGLLGPRRLGIKYGALPFFLVALVIPIVVTANPVGPLYDFVNGTPADAIEVNENFSELKTAVDDNYGRTIVAQQTADDAVAGHTVNTDTQLTELQVDDFVGDNGYAFTTDVQVNAANVQTNTTEITTNTANILTNTSDTAVLQATVAAIQAFLCGDGVIIPSLESCDDGNSSSGDGCSQTCTIEPSFVCSGLPSVCSLPVDVRFIACSDGVSVEDTATGLVWERKLVGDANNVSVNDVNNSYSWSADIASDVQDGTVFTDFLAQLNTNVFGGQGNWRLPSVGEMQSILIGEGVLAVISTDPTSGLNPTGQSTICDSTPCIDPHFLAHAGTASPSYPVAVNGVTAQVNSIAELTTGALPYWSSQSFPPEVSNAYGVNFGANARLPFTVQTPLVEDAVPFGIQLIRKDQGAPQPPSDRREVAVFARAVRSGSCGA
jgi:cysteine-rich repeat protein